MMTQKSLILSCARLVLLAVLSIGFESTSMVAATSEATSAAVGCSRIDIPAGGRVVTPVFVKLSVYTGNGVVSGKTISATGLTPNAFQPTGYNDRPNYPTHYVEITSGAYSGYSYDISSNSSSGVSLYDFPSDLNAQTVSFTIRPHVTLRDLAVGASGLSDYVDAFTLFRSGSQRSVYFFTSTGVVGDDYSTPADDAVIYPGTALIVSASSAASITFNGQVKSTPTVVPIYSGESLVGPIDPQGGKLLTSINIASGLGAYVDAGTILSTDGNLGASTFFSDGSIPLDEGYTPYSDSNAPLVGLGNGFLINSDSDHFWTYFPSF